MYSISRIDLYDRCPWAYKSTYLDKVPREEDESRDTGLELHRLVQSYLNRLISLTLQTDWNWAAAQHSSSEDVAEIWERFYQVFSLPAVLEDPGVERKLAFSRSWEPCDFFAPEAYFRMVIDFHFRQNSLAVVRDWKSSRLMPVTVGKNLQLLAYAWGLCKAIYPGAQEFLLQLYFLRYGITRDVLLTPEDLTGIPKKLEEKIAKIEEDTKFEPRPGSFCGLCGVSAHCPVIARSLVPREFIAPATPEEVQKAAEKLLALRVMAKAITARLKSWASIKGPIPVGDQVYGPSFTDSLDTEKVVQALLDGGLEREEIWPLLSVSKTALKSSLKKLKKRDLLDLVMSLTVGEPETRFDFKKAELVSDITSEKTQIAA
jgi:hypothetical protein